MNGNAVRGNFPIPRIATINQWRGNPQERALSAVLERRRRCDSPVRDPFYHQQVNIKKA
jgi:hypothetical protein